MESLYKVQCKTYAIAMELTKNHSDVSSIEGAFKPPFCLRVVRAYRTKAIQDFRDKVAAQAKLMRK